MKKNLMSVVLLSVFAVTANASEVALTSEDISKAFLGNSIAGVHYTNKTVQYFSKSGLTLWLKEGDETPSEGKWKVENNQYCSDFGSGWGCYRVVNDKEQGIHYFLKDGFRAPFIIQSGFDISF